MDSMSEVSAGAEERARKNLSLCLQRLASVGQREAAEAVGVHESTISRMKEGDLEKVCRLLAACDLKVVPGSYRCAKPEIIEAALVFARAAIEQTSRDQTLVWDD